MTFYNPHEYACMYVLTLEQEPILQTACFDECTAEARLPTPTLFPPLFQCKKLKAYLHISIYFQEFELPEVLKEIQRKKDDVQPKEELKLSV